MHFHSALLLLLLAREAITFGDNHGTTKKAENIFNNILKRSKYLPTHKQPTSNHLAHLLGYSGSDNTTSNHLAHLLGYSGSDNTTHITRGNKTCLKISCVADHYVRSCDFDGGNDTCEPCAKGTFLADNTSSEQYNHECVTYPECFPDATRSLYPNHCTGGHFMYCKCDVTRNFCGHDPCNCQRGRCTYNVPVLRINCGCDRRPTTAKVTTTTTTTMATTTQEMSSIKSTKKVSTTPVHSSPHTTKKQAPLTTARPTTIKPGSGQVDTGLPGGIIALIVIIPIVVVVAAVVALVIWCKKRKSNDSESNDCGPVPAVAYSEVNTNDS